MSDETPVPTAPPVIVSTIQVLSATVQNVVIAAIIAYAWLIAGKLDTSMALGALFTIVGIDFANRARVPGSKAAALAFGATGVLSSMFRATGLMLAVASALSLASCATVDLKPIRTALDMSREAYAALCVPLPESAAAIERCHVAALALDVGTAAYNEVENHAK
jgi:hypothetical protein